MEILDKKLAGRGPEISVYPGVTLFFFSFFFSAFFLSLHKKFSIKNFFSKCDQIHRELYLGIPSLYLGILLSLYPTSNYFWTQHQLTDPPVRSSTLPRRNMLASQGDLLDILFSYCPVLPLFDLFLTHITH